MGDRVFLAYMHYPLDERVRRFDGTPGYTDLRLTVLPIEWFYRDSQ